MGRYNGITSESTVSTEAFFTRTEMVAGLLVSRLETELGVKVTPELLNYYKRDINPVKSCGARPVTLEGKGELNTLNATLAYRASANGTDSYCYNGLVLGLFPGGLYIYNNDTKVIGVYSESVRTTTYPKRHIFSDLDAFVESEFMTAHVTRG